MNEFEKQLVIRAYRMCAFLKEGLIASNELQPIYISSLAYQTGLRTDFIIEHLEEIKGL